MTDPTTIIARAIVTTLAKSAFAGNKAQTLPEEIAQASLAALHEAGRVIVPEVPTDAMVQAGREAANYHAQQRGELTVAIQVWPVMIAAAQKESSHD